jgi:hypothetical protein
VVYLDVPVIEILVVLVVLCAESLSCETLSLIFLAISMIFLFNFGLSFFSLVLLKELGIEGLRADGRIVLATDPPRKLLRLYLLSRLGDLFKLGVYDFISGLFRSSILYYGLPVRLSLLIDLDTLLTLV